MVAKWTPVFVLALLFAQATHARSAGEVVERALANSPDIGVRLQEYLSSGFDQDAARSALGPRVDLHAFYGRESLNQAGSGTRNFNHPGMAVQLRQLLFDGGGTQAEVRRLGHEKAVRYYELLSATEDFSLQVMRAYLGVQAAREEAASAEKHWNTQKDIQAALQRRGTARRGELQQLAARVAAAHSAWLTRLNRVREAGAQFDRLVGEWPTSLQAVPDFSDQLPRDQDVLSAAIHNNPKYLSATARMFAARAQVDSKRASNAPTIELRAQHGYERNHEGIPGNRVHNTAHLTLSYNLFDSGGDRARIRSAQAMSEAARESRNIACRDIRKNTLISWSRYRKERARQLHLEGRATAIADAASDYRKEFEEGQRGLLAVLTAQNESFDAQLALIQGRHDAKLAELTLLAATHRLLPSLGIPVSVGDQPINEEVIMDDAANCNTVMPELG